MKPKIQYDTTIHLAAVGPSVWAKLGPERWFDTYKIAVADKREYEAPFVIDLGIKASDIGEFTTQKIIDTDEFKAVALNELRDYKFIVYRPIDPPNYLSADRFVAQDLSFSRYEDKKFFRETFAGKVPIPRHIFVDLDTFLNSSGGDNYEAYCEQFGPRFVVQDNIAGGGRGTYIISSDADMETCIRTLTLERKGTHIVISEFITGIERSIQVFVSADHTVKGPLQQQLVRNPDLLDPNGRGGVFFCGGRFVFDASPKVRQQVDMIVETISQTLKTAGYRGVFGTDFLVDENENVYAIEVNARTTGLLPLLNEQQAELPLYLLHILELTKQPYEIEVESNEAILEPYTKPTGPRSFVTVFNTTGQHAYLTDKITTGNYTYSDGVLQKLDSEARWNPDADCMIQLFCTESFPARPNLKFCNVFLKEDGFDSQGVLTETAREIAKYVKSQAIIKQ